MAKILLSVGIDPAAKKNFEKQVKDVEGVFKGLTEALNSVSPNKELTKQLNALAKAYNALTNSRKLDLKEEKIAIAQKKVAAAQDKASAALINAETRAKKENRLETEAERKELEKNTKTQEKNAESRSKLIERIGNQAKSILTSAFIRQPLMNLLNLLQGIDDVLVKVENRVIELRRVLNEDIAGGELSGKIYEIAQKYGQTFENVGEIVTNFARTGMTWADSVKATEAAVLALNVAELDATQASEGMIAIMTQFGISASELELVVDKLNKTADNFPVTTEKLLVGLQRTGSAAANANLSLDQTIGLLTTLSKATGRSGANLGTAVNALIQYSTKSSALETFSSLSAEVDNTVQKFKRGGATILDVWRSVSEVIQGADERQQNLLKEMADQDDVKNLSEELQDELGDIFEKEQEVYGTANTFRKNYFIALLKNIDTVQDSIDTISDAAGYSQKENAQYINTYVAKVNQLKDAWEALANDEQGILGFKKLLVDIATGILDITNKIGGLQTVLVALSAIIATIYAAKIREGLVFALERIPKIGSALKSVIPTLKSMWAQIKGIEIAAKDAEAAFQGWIAVIGIAITAFSLISSAIENHYEKIKTDSAAIISAMKAEEEQAQKLSTLVTKYKELQSGSEDYYSVEKEIISILGDKATVLSSLTAGTEAYKQKIIELAEEELKAEENRQKRALGAAENGLEAVLPGTMSGNSSAYYLKGKAGWKVYKEPTQGDPGYGQGWSKYSDHITAYTSGKIGIYWGKTPEEHVAAYKEALALIDYLTEQKEYAAAADLEAQISEIGDWIAKYQSASKALNIISNQKQTIAKTDAESANDLSDVKNLYGDIVDELKEYQKTQEETIKQSEREKSIAEARLYYEQQIAKARKEYISGALDQYLNGLKEEATLAEKQNAIIEKRKALEEALQALEDAKNQRNVRVLNPDGTLGGWQANEKDVKNAQDRVEQATKSVNTAVESLNDYLKNTAIAEIKQKIEDGSASESEIRDILAKWLGLGEGDTAALNAWADGVISTFTQSFNAVKSDNSPILREIEGVKNAVEKLNDAENALTKYFEQKLFDEVIGLLSGDSPVSNEQMRDLLVSYGEVGVSWGVINKMIALIKDVTGIDLTKDQIRTATVRSGQFFGGLRPSDNRTISLYDNGGVLSGIGGIKATREDEIVIDPALTRQILNPQYNKRYEDFVAANRLLFGDSRHIPAANMVRTVNNTSSNDQRSYTINGVPIPQRVAKEYTIEQVFNNMSLFKQ